MHFSYLILNIQHDYQADKDNSHQNDAVDDKSMANIVESVLIDKKFSKPHHCTVEKHCEQHKS